MNEEVRSGDVLSDMDEELRMETEKRNRERRRKMTRTGRGIGRMVNKRYPLWGLSKRGDNGILGSLVIFWGEQVELVGDWRR